MEKNNIRIEDIDTIYREINRFQDIFKLLEKSPENAQYRQAYDESTKLAVDFIYNKNKETWEKESFIIYLKEKFPGVSEGFIGALIRCITNYNPKVNLPHDPLWE